MGVGHLGRICFFFGSAGNHWISGVARASEDDTKENSKVSFGERKRAIEIGCPRRKNPRTESPSKKFASPLGATFPESY